MLPGFIQLGPPITSAVAMCWVPAQDLRPVEFLGITRRDNHNDWGWPGGSLEPNETPAECALRELREETGCIGEIVREVYVGKDKPTSRCAAFEVKIVGKVERAPGETGLVDMVTAEKLYAGRWGEFNRKAIAALFGST